MRSLSLLISHAHDERPLAEAWKKLLEIISMGAIKPWFSSDTNPEGGMQIGQEWREDLRQRIAGCDFVLAILSPKTRDRPWILWECGMANGADRERGIIPVVYSMRPEGLANPLSSFQAYPGDRRERVEEVCSRLLTEAGFSLLAPDLWRAPLDAYESAIAAHRPRRAQRTEDMALWRNRVDELVQSGRRDEVPALRERMYATFGEGFHPVAAQLHDALSKVMLDLGHFADARAEANFALQVVGDDVDLLHRRALAEAGDHQLGEALATLQQLYSINASLRNNPEIAGLEGRIYRQRYRSSGDRRDLDAASDAYSRAFDAHPTSYYAGVNSASLLLHAGEVERAESMYRRVLEVVDEVRSRPPVSYWADFTAGECRLGLGDVESALEDYRSGIMRNPQPAKRDRDSAAGGVIRIASARGFGDDVVARFVKLLE